MLRAETVARVAVAFLALYVGLIVYQGEDHEKHRVYPFGAWSVYSHVPRPDRHDVAVRLLRVRGQDLDEPVDFGSATGIVDTANEGAARVLARSVAAAMERGDTAAAERDRQVLESRFLKKVSPATYQLVYQRFNVLERYRCGCVAEEKVLETVEITP